MKPPHPARLPAHTVACIGTALLFTAAAHANKDWGDAPASYGTLAIDDGPVHSIVPAIHLGSVPPDAELDGQPEPNALGDDQNGIDDEDAVDPASLIFFEGTAPVITVQAFNNTGNLAKLGVWVDWNLDGVFKTDTVEFTFVDVPSNPFLQTIYIPLPPVPTGMVGGDPSGKVSFLRLRITTDHNALNSSGGAALDGEVEDWRIQIFENLDFGDLPDTGPSTGYGNYQTTLANNGPRHLLGLPVYLGASVDAEIGSQHSADAQGDDNSGIDDEDGVTLPLLIPGEPATFLVNATNMTTQKAAIWAYVDFNGDGDFNDPGEAQVVTVNPGTSAQNIPINFQVPFNIVHDRLVGARFRISTDADFVLQGSPYGLLPNGEVEDYLVQIAALDFGDLPDTASGTGPGNYQTLFANNGPRHVIVPELFIRSIIGGLPFEIDAEPDGQPTSNADGDDNNGINDERSGLYFNTDDAELTGTIQIGIQAEVINQTGTPANFYAFFDIDNDGAFDSPGESVPQQIIASNPGPQPASAFLTDIPLADHGPGLMPIYVRMRVSTDDSLGPNGFAPDGEVEDYYFPLPLYGEPWFPDSMINTGSLPDLTPGTGPGDYQTALENGGPGHWVGSLYFGDNPPNANDPLDAPGITLPAAFARSEALEIGINATNGFGTDGWIYAFIDWNNDGDFDDPGEALAPIPIPDGTVSGNFSFPFTVPADAAQSTPLGARFRISNQATLGANGPGGYGEVVDYLIEVKPLDFGDLPDTGPGTGPGNYQTLRVNDGPRHAIIPELYFGVDPDVDVESVDAEPDGQPDATATGDDLDGNDDEDLLVLVSNLSASLDEGYLTGEVTLALGFDEFNFTSQPAWRRIWMDPTGSGDLVEVNAASFIPSQSGPKTVFITLPLENFQPGLSQMFTRMRLSTDNAAIATPHGFAPDGEVMDHLLAFEVLPAAGLYSAGSLPDLTPGTGPGDYQTSLANGGPSHWRHNSLYLGDQPPGSALSPNASGVNLPPAFARSESGVIEVNATNGSGAAGWLHVFIDWNNDGDFEDAGEAFTPIPIPDGTADGSFPVSFTVPADAAQSTPIGARFRISQDLTLGANGHGGYGEVEDFLIEVKPLDFGDLPDTGPGTGPGNYRTLRADDGPRHAITQDLFIRSPLGGGPVIEIDAEPDGQPTADALGDDLNGIGDEGADQLSFNVNFLPDSGTIDIGVQAEVINQTGSPAYFYAFFDIDNDGAFSSPGETALPQIVPSSPEPVPVTVFLTDIPLADFGPGHWPIYVRLRVSTDENLGPNGFASDGEVEDHYFPMPLYGEPFFQDDWISTGSLPDLTPGTGPGDYQTTLENGGPGHWVGSIYFGDNPPNANDPLDAPGITLPAAFARSEALEIGVSASNQFGADGWIYGFIDWNNDGDFDDPGETLAPIPIADGTVNGNFSFPFTVPADAVQSTPIGARFRISNQASLGANGPGGYGEVEDFLITVNLSPVELYQVWAQMNILDPLQRGYLDDPDNDATPNILEYAFLMDPSVADMPPVRIRVETFEFKGDTYFELVFPRRTDHEAVGLIYTPYLNNDLPVLPGFELVEEDPAPIHADLEEARYRSLVPRDGIEPGFGTLGVSIEE